MMREVEEDERREEYGQGQEVDEQPRRIGWQDGEMGDGDGWG